MSILCKKKYAGASSSKQWHVNWGDVIKVKYFKCPVFSR